MGKQSMNAGGSPSSINERTPENRGPARLGGFPAGARQTAIPSVFFSDVLPAIDDPAELLVTLYAFYLVSRRRGSRRWFDEAELAAEPPLMRSLAKVNPDSAAALRGGLDAAVNRGSLLRAVRHRDGRSLRLYAVHMPGAAEMLASLDARVHRPVDGAGGADRQYPLPNIFVLYEENIGVISPLLADQLGTAEADYPWPWIEAAFREAVALNRRSWRYIERILERWRTEGPDLEAIRRSAEGGRKSLAGRYWRLVKR
ncbi:MAG TPA: DnaD domain protein [Dehalococcoidia bacterium]